MNRSAIPLLFSATLALGACAPPSAPPLVQGSPLAYSRPVGAARVSAPMSPSVGKATAVVASPSAASARTPAPNAADTTPRFVAPPAEVEVPSYQLPSNRPLR